MSTKYHYQIVSSFDPTDIPYDSRKEFPSVHAWDTELIAEKVGENRMKVMQLSEYQYYVKVIEVPEEAVDMKTCQYLADVLTDALDNCPEHLDPSSDINYEEWSEEKEFDK